MSGKLTSEGQLYQAGYDAGRADALAVGLDVERLARALLAWAGATALEPTFSVEASPRDMARAIAREYAALTEREAST